MTNPGPGPIILLGLVLLVAGFPAQKGAGGEPVVGTHCKKMCNISELPCPIDADTEKIELSLE